MRDKTVMLILPPSSTYLGIVFALDKVRPFLVPGFDDISMPDSR
jgi:hypothetical protein